MQEPFNSFIHSELRKEGSMFWVTVTCKLCGESIECDLYETNLKACEEHHVTVCPERGNGVISGAA